MPSDGTGTGWNVALPQNNDNVSDGPVEIRDLRKGIALRLNKEHLTLKTSSVGGQHGLGSARIFVQATAPVNKLIAGATEPEEGSVALDSNDKGRLWLDTTLNQLWYWSGTEWVALPVTAANLAADAVTTTAILDEAVTEDKLADDSVGTDNLIAQAVDEAALKDLAVTTGKLATDAVTVDKILDATITTAKLATGAVSKMKIGSYTGDGGSANVVTGVGFRPDFIIITRDGYHGALIGWWGRTTLNILVAGGQAIGGIYLAAITYGADGFTLGSDPASNKYFNGSGVSYTYLALKV